MIYENVSTLCKERGISIARLERETGIGNATIRRWGTSEPTAKNLKRVADYFGVTVDELMRERNNERINRTERPDSGEIR